MADGRSDSEACGPSSQGAGHTVEHLGEEEESAIEVEELGQHIEDQMPSPDDPMQWSLDFVEPSVELLPETGFCGAERGVQPMESRPVRESAELTGTESAGFKGEGGDEAIEGAKLRERMLSAPSIAGISLVSAKPAVVEASDSCWAVAAISPEPVARDLGSVQPADLRGGEAKSKQDERSSLLSVSAKVGERGSLKQVRRSTGRREGAGAPPSLSGDCGELVAEQAELPEKSETSAASLGQVVLTPVTPAGSFFDSEHSCLPISPTRESSHVSRKPHHLAARGSPRRGCPSPSGGRWDCDSSDATMRGTIAATLAQFVTGHEGPGAPCAHHS